MTLGFTRGVWHIDAYNPHGVNDPLGTLGFPSYLQSNGFQGGASDLYQHICVQRFTNTGTDPYGNYRLGQDTGQLSATVDKVHGQHELKFGFDGRLHQMNYIQTNAPVGIFSFDRAAPLPVRGRTIQTTVKRESNIAAATHGQLPDGDHERQFLL